MSTLMMLFRMLMRQIQYLFRKPMTPPVTQTRFAEMVNHAVNHKIRQGHTHRFITLLFVTVDDRVFCRRYSYNEPSWYSAFLGDPEGQVMLDKTVVDISGSVPPDLDAINPKVNEAYRKKLEQLGALRLLSGATEARALASTFELKLRRPSGD